MGEDQWNDTWGNAEVSNFRETLTVNHHVMRLDIAVDDSLSGHRLKTSGDLLSDIENVLEWLN